MRLLLVVATVFFVSVSPARAAEPVALANARIRYNAGDYEGAISAAAVARNTAAAADAAALVIARAHLELYRQRVLPEDLATARQTLQMIQVGNLSSRDQADLYIGLGQALYLGEVFGAAAEMFDTVLATRTTILAPSEHRQLLDWWATALDHDAQARTPERRSRVYERVMARMEDELKQDPSNPTANYWLAVAARGLGDPDRAWDIAVAAWVRSSVLPEPGTTLRADLDRLVGEALIPERARLRPAAEQQLAMTMLKAEWDLVKDQWK
jgi:hypothetical protein